MAVLIYACCGPCLFYPASEILNNQKDFSVYFYNPNIHPYKEFRNRLNSIIEFCSAHNYPLFYDPDYGLMDFLRMIVFREKSRCRLCYYMRLKKTVTFALEQKFDSFTTTLLYSKYQNHSLIKSLSDDLSLQFSLPFYYQDFRVGWQLGVDASVKLGLYRQKYCGCIFSEQERFDNRLKKKLRKEKKSHV